MRKLLYRNNYTLPIRQRNTWMMVAVGGLSAVGAGGMAWSDAAKKEKAAKDRISNIENMQLEKYPMPQDTEAGGYSLPILKERAAGKGVAFSPDQLTMYGNPYATAAQNQWNAYGKPATEESWASRGLSKSPMAAQGVMQGEKDLADMIGVNWAELNKWNETLKQQGITNGLSSLYNYMNSELNQKNKNVGTENSRRELVAGLDRYTGEEPWVKGVGTGVQTFANVMGAGSGTGGSGWEALLSKLGSGAAGSGNSVSIEPSRSIDTTSDGFASGGGTIAELLKKRSMAKYGY